MHLVYTARKISNMFRATLTERIAKQLNMPDNLVIDILEAIVEKANNYAKKVNHSKGPILQIDRQLYSKAHEIIKKSDF